MKARYKEEVIHVYDDNNQIMFAWKHEAFKQEYWQRMYDILKELWEYESPHHNNKYQLKLNFKN